MRLKDYDMFEIKLEPFKVYQKYASEDYVLCGISFNFSDKNLSFRSECNNNCLLEILSAIDDYFDGRIKKDTELDYDVPWIAGGVIKYNFSFEVNVKEKRWIFRYKNHTIADERFKKNIDKYGEGPAEFAAKAICAFTEVP